MCWSSQPPQIFGAAPNICGCGDQPAQHHTTLYVVLVLVRRAYNTNFQETKTPRIISNNNNNKNITTVASTITSTNYQQKYCAPAFGAGVNEI